MLPVFCITKFQHFHPNIQFLRNIALQFQSNPPKRRCRAMQNAPIKACESWQSSAQQMRLFLIFSIIQRKGSADKENTPEAAPTQAPTPSHPQGNPRQIGFLQLQKAVCPAWLQTLQLQINLRPFCPRMMGKRPPRRLQNFRSTQFDWLVSVLCKSKELLSPRKQGFVCNIRKSAAPSSSSVISVSFSCCDKISSPAASQQSPKPISVRSA